MIHLTVVSDGPSAGLSLASHTADILRIGRDPASDVILPEHHVSGQHASVVYNGMSWVLRDHHSTNGSRVLRDGTEYDLASQAGRELILQSGDHLLFGERSTAVEVKVKIDEDDDGARIVSVRNVAELEAVEKTVDRELFHDLYDAQKSISASLDIAGLLSSVSAEIFRFLSRATHVTFALREADKDGKSAKSSRYIPIATEVRGGTKPEESVPITRSVFRRVVKERAAVLAADARSEVGETASLMAAQILSTIGIPLWSGEDIIGVIQVDNRASKGLFQERDLDVLALLAQAASQGFARARLIEQLRAAEERQRTENTFLKEREERRRFDGIIGESSAMERLFEQLKKVVDTRVTVLVEGETGTGKELVASAVHYWSKRREKLFIAQNCAAMPENLLESELFGHKKGAFTGAANDKKGLFELADGGTLFLDEVGEMPLQLQAKLLRVLQEGEVRPVGASRVIKVDTRIVAATNRDLQKEVEEGRFRQDLFYRLKVFPISVPPLRDRGDDIVLLARHFLKRYAAEFDRDVREFSKEALDGIRSYAWPGNVRELENEIQRLVIQVDDSEFVQAQHLSDRLGVSKGRARPKKGTLKEMMEEVEIELLRDALDEHGNNKTATAKSLGITREGLYKKLKNYGI